MLKLALLPARGGSKGIPRKNLRPLAGKPLIYYAIAASLESDLVDRVVVSTDDDEIALFAERFGACVLMRPAELSSDLTTLDPVIAHAVREAEEVWSERYATVITVQPTSPLVTSEEIDGAIRMLEESCSDTVISVVDDRHLCWGMDEGRAVARYQERVNRQLLPMNFKETGAIIACTRSQIEKGTRIGSKVSLLELPHERSFDIDTYSDLALCESLLKRRRIAFAVIGNPEVGLGHVYRTILLAHELVNYELHFICEVNNQLAIDHIRNSNYHVIECPEGGLAQACRDLRPDMVINDILDTDKGYVESLKSAEITVVNFEDLGPGIESADLVINALYPLQTKHSNILVGPKYFCLRDEFLYMPPRRVRSEVERILLTFGGVDEGNLTVRCLRALAPIFQNLDIHLDIVLGPGYVHRGALDKCLGELPSERISVSNSTSRISEYMANSDLAITSGGRTVLELAALAIPTVVICQNNREMSHTFAAPANGILNLGHREVVEDSDICEAISDLVRDQAQRMDMREKASRFDLRSGKARVVNRITKLLHN